MVAPRTSVHAPKAYLVESSAGDLLMVQRFLKQKDHEIQLLTSGFKIFKLQHSTATAIAGWIEIKSLGDDALFLGDNHSLCISVANVTGCKSNSIYYTDDYDDATTYEAFGPRDMGVFNLEDASFGLHYKLDPSQKHMPPALWIVPTLPKFGSNLSSSA
ncbi:hypothetical protein L1049_027745 [Liquidambar formosana]|uniref:KIB1-4 beta-propeller domain-containing protein n=1 Tax=Liquidambar formosana TaxID=63359 RepID=A0AAP0WVV7_LIQFO